MIFPTVHLNGTSRKELIAQYERAMDAAQTAINALREVYPNGRDYYPQGASAMYQAAEEHAARMNNLFAVRTTWKPF